MSFREETALLAADLAELAASRSSRHLDQDGLAVALIARRDTLRLLHRVLFTATNQAGTPRGWVGAVRDTLSINYVEERPVAALLRTLNTVPLPTAGTDDAAQVIGPPTRSDLETPALKGWSSVRRHVVLADYEWSQRAPVPTGAALWSAVADVAATAGVVAALDHDLLVAARADPDTDPDVIDALTRATVSGLRVAAGEAGALAASGPLPDWTTPGPELNPTRVIIVRSPGHVIAAQKRLASLITAVDALGPEAVIQLVKNQAQFLVNAARGLADVDPVRAQQAATLADALRSSMRTDRHNLASLDEDDPRPLLQTRSLLTAVTMAGARGWAHPDARPYLPALAAGTDNARDVVSALASRARSSLYSGQWLMSNPTTTSEGNYRWRRARPKEWERPNPLRRENAHQQAPRLLNALEAAAALATSLSTPAAPLIPVGDRLPPPREALARVATDCFRDRPGAVTASTIDRDGTPTRSLSLKRPGDTVASPVSYQQETERPPAPTQRWATLADQLDPRLTQQPDWAATAGALQLVHDHGHDVATISRDVLERGPLGGRPAQELRYRLAPHLDLPATGATNRDPGHPPDNTGKAPTAIDPPPGEPHTQLSGGSAGARTAERHPHPAGQPTGGMPPAR